METKNADQATSSTCAAAQKPVLSYNDKQEADIRQRLMKKVPTNRYDKIRDHALVETPLDLFSSQVWSQIHAELAPVADPAFQSVQNQLNKLGKLLQRGELTKEEHTKRSEPLSKSYHEILEIFNQAKDSWEERVHQEVKRRWDRLAQEQRQPYVLHAEYKSQQMTEQMAEQEYFAQELKDLIALTTSKNRMIHPTSTTSEPKPTVRYPDHEFAIQESYIVFNWALANCFLMALDDSIPLPEIMVSETNIPATIPTFVDSHWAGWDTVHHVCPKAKKARFDSLSKSDQELKWLETGYYKVYPPNDKYIEDDEDGFTEKYASFGHSLPFRRSSIRRYIQLVQNDLSESQWTKSTFVESIFTGDSQTGRLKTPVTAFRSNRGDRVEFWDYDPGEEDDSYAILQTHRGRVVAIAVSGGHPYAFCNLLEFFDSDGSADMPDLTPKEQVGQDEEAEPSILIANILKTFEIFLYG
uniref:Uncharacterized protein n=2 Tax=Odontella aurita TaxID=265563 RepID=A0A7S4K1G1_9STRA|mmetsp:Transcript_59157/g.175828  ORF Transcript_59157/g.175828 Transcript_59157/m.175828 type:complete len:469 (+) Transcript_59157:140-1546(+)